MTADTVSFTTTSGHTVLLDREDWTALEPLLQAGVRLQAVTQHGGNIKVMLREYGTGMEPQKTMLLSKVILGAQESQVVTMLNGPLDHRRHFMVLGDAGHRQGWASRIHRAQGVS